MADRRRAERTGEHGLRCSRGQVVDASSRGMRLRTRSRWAEGERRLVTLRCGAEEANVWAEAVWSRREAFMCYAVGLAFVDVTAEERGFLERAVSAGGGRGAGGALIPLGLSGSEREAA